MPAGAPSESPHGHIAALDGLRGLAIFVVLWYHYWMLAPVAPALIVGGHRLSIAIVAQTGWVGVNLFFFISGFVIFYPYARSMVDGSPAQTLRAFFIKRLLKIVPSYYLSTIVLVAIGYTQLTAGSALRQLAVHAFFLHPFLPSTFYALNGVTWSLGVEVQFYVLFACLWGLIRRAPVAAFATLALGSVLYRSVVLAHANAAQASFLLDELPAYLDIFAAGMACAFAYRWIDVRCPALARRRAVWTALAIAAGAVFYALLFGIEALGPHSPLVEAVGAQSVEAILFFGIALGSLFALPAWRTLLANPIALGLAAISYNLYLWHQAVAVEIARAIGGASQVVPPALYLPFLALSVVLSLLVAIAMTLWFERPLIALGRGLTQPFANADDRPDARPREVVP
jgi:peptidoglycan/LPS O-acetylase OafA/YrhL